MCVGVQGIGTSKHELQFLTHHGVTHRNVADRKTPLHARERSLHTAPAGTRAPEQRLDKR
jgi:hypothetical protein